MESNKLLRPPDVPSDIAALCRRVEQWRQTRRQGKPMPEPLWKLAARLADQYSVARISKLARLDYYTLKERLTELGRDDLAKSGERPAFVELTLPPPSTPVPECTVELENRRGGRMRIQLRGVAAPDLAALSRSFWSAES